ncbi:MAG: hypothetical protein QOI54_2244, partial [Actinomycetota bacterium]|nr:hypothetical protein [Actinomycetota bacterium]
MTLPAPAAGTTPATATPDPRRWLALAVIAVAQLMIVLDASIVNIALPQAQGDLGITDANRQWVITAYTLAFGGLLLLGGRIADYTGRKRTFIIGLLGFAGASALGGIAPNQELLFAARALQGAFAALMAPAALSLVTVTFTEPRERAKAFGVFGALSGGGAAIGLIVGGVLTEYASWRWVLFVNVPIAAIAIFGAITFVPESKDERAKGFDIPGAVLVTGGLMTLVYALVKGNQYGWASGKTVGMLVLAAALLASFVAVQVRSDNPLVPFRLFRSRTVLAADLGSLLVGAGIFAIFFFLILWMQQVNGYSPVKSGLLFLPMTFLIGISAGVGSQLLGKIGPRPLLLVGPSLAGLGLLMLGLRLDVHSSYLSVILPSLACVAFGMGMTFVALTSSAVAGVPHEDAGIASALLNAGQQVGG